MNVNSGRAVWKYATDGAIHSTPLVVNELVYVGSESGSVYAIDFRGVMKWRFQAKRPITASPTVGIRHYSLLLWIAPSIRLI